MDAHLKDSVEYRAYKIRRHVVETCARRGDGHAGPSLSCADIMATLYFAVMNFDPKNPKDPDRDRFLLSAGHKCLALYGAFVEMGVIEKSVLDETYNTLGTIVPGHPDAKKINAIDFSTGSLGHGLPIGCGLALGAKLAGKSFKTYVLMGDGEHGEGSVWEAASFAAAKGLDNLVAIVDNNGLQINGTNAEVCCPTPIGERYRAFGWTVVEVNGHDVAELYNALTNCPVKEGKPTLIVAKTIKSKGMSFAEGNVKYHHWNPGKEEAERAIAELDEYGKRWQE
ncbi:MAG: transketolase [Christensenellales bacterium]|jgi:transketolase